MKIKLNRKQNARGKEVNFSLDFNLKIFAKSKIQVLRAFGPAK